MRININDTIGFKLTRRGVELWNHYHSQYDVDDIVSIVSPGLYFEEQIWKVMEIFGPHIFHSQVQLFEDNIWDLKDEKLKTQALTRVDYE